jgi:hypothetical protein
MALIEGSGGGGTKSILTTKVPKIDWGKYYSGGSSYSPRKKRTTTYVNPVTGLNAQQQAEAARYTGLAFFNAALPDKVSNDLWGEFPDEWSSKSFKNRMNTIYGDYTEGGSGNMQDIRETFYSLDDDGWWKLKEEQASGGGGGYYGGGYGGYGAPEEPEPIEWIVGDYSVGENAPEWWRPFTVKNKDHFSNPMVAGTLMMNAMIGSGQLSEEDSRTMAKQLYAMWGQKTADNPWDIYSDKFGDDRMVGGLPAMGATFDPRISREQQILGQSGPGVIDNDFFNTERATDMLDSLSKMREATVGGNVHKFGSMYGALQNIIGATRSAGDANTRAKQLQVLGELDPLMAQLKGSPETSGLSAMARMIASPFYTNLPPQVSRDQAGDYQFGKRSKYLTF